MIKLYNYASEKEAVLNNLRNRQDFGTLAHLESVKSILKDVKEKGDKALFEYTKKFDGFDLNKDNILVSKKEIEDAYKKVSPELLSAMRNAKDNIRNYHEMQKQKTWLDIKDGYSLGQLINPIESVGVYVPGGTAAYPSSVLMNVLPAKVAGVKEIYMVTPPGKNGELNPLCVVAAVEAGVDAIYKIGGAQAIGALCYGTESIKRVHKIVGPGNIYVALAKREVFGYVGIDMIAGPSEILVVADNSANPVYVAADMLSQAEHDTMAAAMLITNDKKLAHEVQKELEVQLSKLERSDIARKSIDDYGAIIVTDDINNAFMLANEAAPEHLELCVVNPFECLSKVKNAGAIFLGHYTPEPVGDYYAGPNHVLPTSGTARFFSPLSVDDFIKKSSIVYYTKEQLLSSADDIIIFANTEGLTAHANAIAVRKNNK